MPILWVFSPQKVAALGYSTFVCSSQVFKNQHVNEFFFSLFYCNVLLDKNYISDQTVGLQIFILGKTLINVLRQKHPRCKIRFLWF